MSKPEDDTPQSALHAELGALIDAAYAPPPSPAAIEPDLSTTSTLDLLTEAHALEAHLAATPQPVDPAVWAARGHGLADYPLLSSKRLADVTPEEREAEHKAMASRAAYLERLVILHRELAARRLTPKAVIH